jgi:uncharacterized membrane protein
MNPWEFHPAVVHFPIALLSTGFLLACLPPLVHERRVGVESAFRILLYLGTLSAWLAFFLGHLAEDTAPHVAAAWQTLHDHEMLATRTVWLFTALSAARVWLDRKKTSKRLEWAFLALWLFSVGGLFATGWFGGQLVTKYNVGTAASKP